MLVSLHLLPISGPSPLSLSVFPYLSFVRFLSFLFSSHLNPSSARQQQPTSQQQTNFFFVEQTCCVDVSLPVCITFVCVCLSGPVLLPCLQHLHHCTILINLWLWLLIARAKKVRVNRPICGRQCCVVRQAFSILFTSAHRTKSSWLIPHSVFFFLFSTNSSTTAVSVPVWVDCNLKLFIDNRYPLDSSAVVPCLQLWINCFSVSVALRFVICNCHLSP